jgi:hypothetical protein
MTAFSGGTLEVTKGRFWVISPDYDFDEDTPSARDGPEEGT